MLEKDTFKNLIYETDQEMFELFGLRKLWSLVLAKWGLFISKTHSVMIAVWSLTNRQEPPSRFIILIGVCIKHFILEF